MSGGSLPQEPSGDPGDLSGGFFRELFPLLLPVPNTRIRCAPGCCVDDWWAQWAHAGPIDASSSQMLVSDSYDRTINLRYVSERALQETYDEETCLKVLSVAYSPNGSKLA